MRSTRTAFPGQVRAALEYAAANQYEYGPGLRDVAQRMAAREPVGFEEATLGVGKIATGLDAIRYYREGRWDELTRRRREPARRLSGVDSPSGRGAGHARC